MITLPKNTDQEVLAEALDVLNEKKDLQIPFEDLYYLILFEKQLKECK